MLQGTWSRLDYMTKTMQAASSVVADFQAVLPAGAHSIYYRDGIGNISTSNTRYSLRSVEVDLRPRYPLLGGWKVSHDDLLAHVTRAPMLAQFFVHLQRHD